MACLHPHKGLRNHPLCTYLKPGCRSSFFTCEKKISCERPGRRLSHETLEELPSPGRQRTFQNCDQNQDKLKKEM